MNLQDILMQAGGGAAVDQIAQRFGIPADVARGAIGALLPAVQSGFKTQAQEAGGADALIGGLIKPEAHAAYVDDPQAVAGQGATDIGNEILGQIFGSKDVSRGVAAQAAGATGLDTGLLKQLLPVVAAMAAGAMAKGAGGGAAGGAGGGLVGQVLGGLLGGAGGQQQGGLGGLAAMLDFDKDGNPLDDILGMLNKR